MKKSISSPSEQLKAAILADNLPRVKSIVESGEVNIVEQNTFINLAVENNAYAVAKYLLEGGSCPNDLYLIPGVKGIKIDLCYRWTLEVAARKNAEMMKLLIHHGADVTKTLTTAGRSYRTTKKDCQKLLLENRASEKRSEIEAISQHADEHYAIVYQRLFDYAVGCGFRNKNKPLPGIVYGRWLPSEQRTSIHFPYIKNVDVSGFSFVGVSIDGKPVTREIVKELGALGADNAFYTLEDLDRMEEAPRREALKKRVKKSIEKTGGLIFSDGTIDLAPLSEVAKFGYIESVRARLRKINPNTCANATHSPICYAAEQGHLEIVTLLAAHPDIDKEAVVEALALAKNNHHTSVIDYLSGMIGVDQVDAAGNSLLHLAVRDSDLGKTQALIARGSDVNLNNGKYETPLSFALQKSFKKNAEVEMSVLTVLLNNNATIYDEHLARGAKNNNCAVFSLLLAAAGKQASRPNISTQTLSSIMMYPESAIAKLTALKMNGFDIQYEGKGYSLLKDSMEALMKAADCLFAKTNEVFNLFVDGSFERVFDSFGGAEKEVVIKRQAVFKDRLALVHFLLDEDACPRRKGLSYLIDNFYELPPVIYSDLFNRMIVDQAPQDSDSVEPRLTKAYHERRTRLEARIKELEGRRGPQWFGSHNAEWLSIEEKELTCLHQSYELALAAQQNTSVYVTKLRH